MNQTASIFRFVDVPLEQFPNPELNVYLKQYWEAGPPVLRGADAQKAAQNWDAIFPKTAPLHLEIGSGNGFFLAGMAEQFSEYNWIGVEIRYKRVMLTSKKIQAKELSNARIMRYDAWQMEELFGDNTLSGLYVNHPDPWQKKRQAKKRLLNPEFCAWASRALKVNGVWRIKTDFAPHIEAVVEYTKSLPFKVTHRSNDIHKDGVPWEKDIETNYESKFRAQGLPVYALELMRI